MATINLMVVNCTDRTLEYVGTKGDEVAKGWDTTIGPKQAGAVATFADGRRRWGWVYLKDTTTGAFYQIYIERTLADGLYANFGYKNDNSGQSNSNPSKFPQDTEACCWGGGSTAFYALLKPPPKP